MKFEKSLVSGSTALLVLSLLSDGDKYGYEMVLELARRSNQAFELKEGTLYPLLTRLKNDGLLRYEWQESKQGPPRKYYALTDEGQDALTQLDASWEELARTVAILQSGQHLLENIEQE